MRTLHVKYKPIKCEYCNAEIREDHMSRHIKSKHSLILLPVIVKQTKVNNISVSKQPRGLIRLPETIGSQVLAGLEKRERWIAKSFETCRTCHKRIIYLEIGKRIEKAFDVSGNKVITGTHACREHPRSESIYTYSGGIVDSNRRYH